MILQHKIILTKFKVTFLGTQILSFTMPGVIWSLAWCQYKQSFVVSLVPSPLIRQEKNGWKQRKYYYIILYISLLQRECRGSPKSHQSSIWSWIWCLIVASQLTFKSSQVKVKSQSSSANFPITKWLLLCNLAVKWKCFAIIYYQGIFF